MTRFSQLALIALALTSLGVTGIGTAHAQGDFTLTNRAVWGPNGGTVTTNIGIPNGGTFSGKITVTNIVPGTNNTVAFSAMLNATGPVVTFWPNPLVLNHWTGDSANTTMTINVGPNVAHGGYLLNVTASSDTNTHFILYQLKVYTIAITIDGQSTGPTDQTIETSASEPKTFRVGVLVSNATSTGGTHPVCTVSFPCGLSLYGWQFGLTYDPTVLIPQGDPNPLATPGNPNGFYVDSAEGTILLGNQPNIGEGGATWATLFESGHAFALTSGRPGEIAEAYILLNPQQPAFLTSTIPNTHYLLASVAFELLRKPTTPTLVSIHVSNTTSDSSSTTLVDYYARSACACVISTAAGEGGVAAETVTNAPPTASFSVTPLPAGDTSCAPITGANCSPYAFVLDARGSTDPDSTSPLQYFWDFGDGTRDSPAETAHGCPEAILILNCSQGAVAIHDYLVAGAADTSPLTLRVADTDGTTLCAAGAACATGAAMDLSGNPLHNSQPSHTSRGSEPLPLPPPNLPPPSLFTFSPSSAAVGENVFFLVNRDLTGYFSGSLYSWDFGDGTTGAGDRTSHLYDNPGNYTVVLTVQDMVDRALIRVHAPNSTEPHLVWTRGLTQGGVSISVGPTGVFTAGGWGMKRYDFNGTLVWTRGTSWLAQSVAVGSDGIYVAEQLYVEKYDFNGNRVWAHSYQESRWATAVSANADGVYVAGGSYGNDSFVTHFDPNGNELWTLQMPTNQFAISVGPKGIYTLGCCTENKASGLNQDAQLAAIDFKGTELWKADTGTFSGTSRNAPFPMSVSAGPDGIYVSVESGLSTITGIDRGFVRKYDFRGEQEWTHLFQSEGPSAVSASSKGVYVAGGTGSCSTQCTNSIQYFFVAYLDSKGNQVWMLHFDSGDYYHYAPSVSSTEGIFVLVIGYISRVAPPDPVHSNHHALLQTKIRSF